MKSAIIGIGGSSVLTEVDALSKTAGKTLNVKSGGVEGFANSEPLKPASVPAKWDIWTDVVVVGGGGAGLCAAIAAKEAGAQVLILEKNPYCGGDSSLANRVLDTYGRRVPKIIGKPEISMEQHANKFSSVRNSAPCTSSSAARVVIEAQDETSEWTEKPEEDWNSLHMYSGGFIIRNLERKARALGIKILIESPAIAIVKDGSRAVGVAVKSDSKIMYVKAKSVVLTTGGFYANIDMMNKYTILRRDKSGPRPMGFPGATGDGIRMAQALGADLRAMDKFECRDGDALRHVKQESIKPALYYMMPGQLFRQKSLKVNLIAERFFNEAQDLDYCRNQVVSSGDEANETCFSLFDRNCINRDDIIKKFIPVGREYPCFWWDEQFDKFLANGIIKKANSIPELATLLALNPDALSKTVNRYNELCDLKEDIDYWKEPHYMHPIRTPPFYGIGQPCGIVFNTWGGLVVDKKFRVLNKHGDSIPGLYAAGENAAFLASLAFAIPSGRLAGKSASEDALRK